MESSQCACSSPYRIVDKAAGRARSGSSHRKRLSRCEGRATAEPYRQTVNVLIDLNATGWQCGGICKQVNPSPPF